MPKQPGTGLDRATKSIPLAGGIVEEVDDFLLEPGGMQYMENLRFTKKDVAEKARGRSTGVATGVTNHTTVANGIWAEGNKVAVVGNDKIGTSSDGGATFDQVNLDTDLMGIESALRTAEQTGGMHYSWAPIGTYTAGTPNTYPISGYVVGFERIQSATTGNNRDVVVQIYDAEGRMIEETIKGGCGAPKVHPYSGGVIVSMVEKATREIVVYIVVDGTPSLGSSISDVARSVQDYCQVYNDTDEEWGNVGTTYDHNLMRLGYSLDMKDNNFAFDSFNRIEDVYGVRAWKDGAGAIKLVRTWLGLPTGSVSTVQTDSATLFGTLLDVSADDSYIYCLYAQTRNLKGATAHSDLKVTRMNLDITSPTTKTLESGLTATYVNGSVRTDSNGDAHMAWTRAAGTPVQNQLDTAGAHGVTWQVLDSDWSTINDASYFWSYRLVSDVAIDQNDKAYVCAQQWDNWNPGAGGTAPRDLDIPLFTPTHKKPVTTVLINLTQTGAEDHLVVATFDAGQSKGCLPASDEQSIHMSGELYYFSAQATGAGTHQFWYGNTVLLTASDTSFFATITTDRPNPSVDGRMQMHPGSTRFAAYRISSEIQVNSTNLTNGMFMGTAVPTWYDGSVEICSMSPIDSPEITYFYDNGGDNMGSYMAYQDAVVAADEAKAYQAVVGYYDDAGLVHRSAPSATVYVGKTKAEDTTGTVGTFYVTPIIGVARNRKYFVEIYEAWPGGVPQLAGSNHVSRNSGFIQSTVQVAVNASPLVAIDQDIADVRASKTIYTAGNVLASDPWPNFDLVVQSGRRLFAHSISDPSTIYYSKTFEAGVAPEFSASLTVTLGNETITAMGAIDDKVILFSAKGCWVLYGTGPDNTGANGDFFVEKMVYPVGCTDQQSIITMEQGIAFYSSTTEEFHIFSRDLQLADVGDAVKTISAGITDVVDSIVVPNDHEIRWYCTRTVGPEYVADSATNSPPQPPRPFIENQAPAGSIFVYNYKYQKWSIIEDAAVRTQRAVISNNSILELADDWDVYPLDNSSWDKLCKWETPWIKVNQLQDFGRFYGLTFLGKYMSSWSGSPVQAGDLQVTVRYDYEGALGDTHVERFRANVDLDPADGDRLQFRVRPKRQKCQAIKLQIEEVATTAVELWEPTYTTGQGFVLTGVDVHYGAKGGSGDKSLGSSRRKG
jgi:hypothetical protein